MEHFEEMYQYDMKRAQVITMEQTINKETGNQAGRCDDQDKNYKDNKDDDSSIDYGDKARNAESVRGAGEPP